MFLQKLILQRKVNVGSVLCPNQVTACASRAVSRFILERCAILQRLQRWQSTWSVSEEPACKLGILQCFAVLEHPAAASGWCRSRCLGRELHICVSGRWVLTAGVGCLRMHQCLPAVRGSGKLEGISGHLFQSFPCSRASFTVKSDLQELQGDF